MTHQKEHKIKLFTRRGPLIILYETLLSLQEPKVKTRAMQRSRLNYPHFLIYFKHLLKLNLIEEIHIPTSYKGLAKTREKYVISTKGKLVIENFEQLFDSLGFSGQIMERFGGTSRTYPRVVYNAFTGQKRKEN